MKLWTKLAEINQTTNLKFQIGIASWYLVYVSAWVKSEKQMGKSATDDEDLRVEIGDFKFPKLDNPNRYFDSPAAFSGGKLHNCLKTVYFVLRLSQGKHTLSLIPDKSALIKKVEVQEIVEFPNLTLNLEEQAEKGNGRPWMTFVLVDVGLKSFTIKATVNWKFPDGDDIKIVVDGKTKRNWFSVLHHYWIFVSNILWKIFGKETIERTFEENLPKSNLHYLEIWADETPILHFIELEIETSTEKETPPAIQEYGPGPNGENYNRFDKEIIDTTLYWNDSFLTQEYPPPKPLDPSLVKAMVYYETGMGYHEGPNDPYPDVMQIGNPENPAIGALLEETPANEFVNKNTYSHISYSYPKNRTPNAKTPSESIFWGVRYLYYRAQSFIGESEGSIAPYVRSWVAWDEAVQLYNSNQKKAPGIGDPNYGENVQKVYRDGIDPRSGRKVW